MMQWIGWRRQREAWRPPETAVLIGSATLVGLATGLGTVAFVWLMARVGELAALVALLFIRLRYAAESRFDDWAVPLLVKAALGPGLTGLLASLAPERAVLGSGNSGGVFAPSLFMGATLGGLVGAAAHQL